MANEYKKTTNLPQTGFPMRASLAQNEPKRLKEWYDNDVYAQLLKKNEGHDKFVLHDGPPYANGPIHLGHAQNKISKDIINRFWAMQGYQTPYVPGWDCHGLPIEWKIEEENYRAKGRQKPDLLDSSAMIAFRRECRAYADKWLDVQRAEFMRLGVIGDLLSANSSMVQRVFERVRRIELQLDTPPSHYEPGATATGQPATTGARAGQRTEEREALEV